ncbi:MAG: hypothetical protein J3K34DRAFT_526736 [Monoraphidium minutum]|nr:MAG: hypothetical protein J3K34DRAFT_526736 [Monoraphidium minutum]
MAQQDKEAELASLFEKVDQFAEHGQHSKGLKVIEQILKLSPGDEDALRCKVVGLVNEGEFDEALKVLGHKRLEGKMHFERAYALYRVGRLQDALKAAGEVGDDMRSEALQLTAQLHYRLGNAAECVAAYDALAKEFKVDSLELKTNILAAYVAGGLSRQLPDLMGSLKVTPKSSFEVAFNRACGLVEGGDLGGAETALRVAVKQGEEALYEEDLGEDEVLDELAPLGVQLAWVLGRQGRHAEAVERLEPLVGGELSDPATAAVAAINFVADGHAADPHQKGFYGRAIKRLDALLDRASADPLALGHGLGSRLSAAQRTALHLNRALLYLMSGKADAARELAGHLAKAFPDNSLVVMLQAVLLARGGKAADADKLLSGLAGRAPPGADPDSDAALAPQLLRAQLALEGGDAPGALAALAGLGGGLPMAPGVLATRVALMEQAGDTAGAEALLEAALAHFQSAAKAGGRGGGDAAADGVGWCLQRLVGLKLQLDKASEATQLFLQQQKAAAGGRKGGAAAGGRPADAGALARLCRAAAAAGDGGAAGVLAQQLPGGVEAAGRGLDPDALEDLTRALNSVRAQRRREAEAEAAAGGGADAGSAGAPAKRRRGGGGEDGGAKKKRKRKPRLPKGYDATKPNGGLPLPDPERWLPKWQRSDYKKKQKRRRDRTEGPVKGSQGAGKVDESLDRAARKGEAPEADAKGKGAAGPGARPSLPQRKGGKK